MPIPTEKLIKNSISNHKRGKIFFPKNFSKFGTSEAIRQALKRLEDKGFLIRLAQGIYLYPKEHKLLGTLYPSLEEIAKAISKRDKARIIPTGIQALNQLGLSTQVPLNLVYLTDGTSRTISVGENTIKFKKASPKILAVKSETNILIMQALRQLGKHNIDDKTLEKINMILQKVDRESIVHDMKLAPVWISEIMQNSLSKREPT
ncbi:DUF6088 family protein [Allomuricauda sp. XS_ASV26]|jgi:predicted transcriptional regulator of viral defense system|uniref:Transcriptional regulator, AbiEi antitoxin, Type IV TA system n=6 Tax=Flagellimonas TaxID=444459 RepID=A0A1H2R9R1_9FLAO|nr:MULTISPECIES: DUF6088 family protein [Allomuricauda]MBC71531.1 hypothetical protein [Allomuricauda sp.]MCR9264797.1 type IV toxin-antitoxin system AbiEi family antitoxin domain-containing protein [Flavobacteriaceae bacterium]UBZ14512.1 type IV toxin-antitoxin system AbiEi family antitoxin domain-containing protein [Allomuricauda aquimarina]MBO0341551.1 type IV toxin-antitoxin system AbiEi family antitoxin domain-containing protein [Allomuricauda profundi]MBO0355867.1 type IV toxin-antitoxin|tara:strand:- start:873 stop:1487 length:615 start_codon:yes stop_codon:yes gene_type:complete